MTMQTKWIFHRRRRRGAVLVYAILGMTTLLAVASVAVDWGRAQVAKTQLVAATDAAARAGAAALARSPSDAIADAKWAASLNSVDGSGLKLKSSDIELGAWDTRMLTFTKYTGSSQYQANACRVLSKRIDSRDTAVPLSFASIFGRDSLDEHAETIAMLISAINVDQPVPATANPFLAGMPAGSVASLYNPHNSPDYAGTATNPKQSPLAVNLPISEGQKLTFDSIDGVARHDPGLTDFNPDGQDTDIGHNTNGSENGIADMTAPINALVGVFLTDAAPNLSATPASLNFTTAASRDFRTLSPKVKQIFFIGDGLDSKGVRQEFVVPPGATRLFLATWDFFEWNNNSGTRTVKVDRPQQIVTVR